MIRKFIFILAVFFLNQAVCQRTETVYLDKNEPAKRDLRLTTDGKENQENVYMGLRIQELNRLGNPDAVLITTRNKGFRKPENKRHPHSWSIVDNDELIRWLLRK